MEKNEVQLDSDEVIHLSHLLIDHANSIQGRGYEYKFNQDLNNKLLMVFGNNATFTLRRNHAISEEEKEGEQ